MTPGRVSSPPIRRLLATLGISLLAARAAADAPPVCAPGSPLQLSGSVADDQEKSYLLLPFAVPARTGDPGTTDVTRIEVGYGWTDHNPLPTNPVTQTVFDLGLWDEAGTTGTNAFRGWSGSRLGKLPDTIHVAAASASRGYTPGAIKPGTWHVELGVAALNPAGATWHVEISCHTEPPVADAPASDPVDTTHIAKGQPGWYHADFHMHGYHSHANGPTWEAFIAQARTAGLDILMVTEYVVGTHWHELGATQEANPDLLLWPGREIITYFGHANTFGETPSTLEYRHGHQGISLRGIQKDAVADGALFGINHPTTFPGPVFSNLCRGCEFELDDEVDWTQVDTIEVINAQVLARSSDVGIPDFSGQSAQNPFIQTAIDYWEDKLLQGYRITAVSGSDSKGQERGDEFLRKGYGASATAIYAADLSRAAVTEAIRAGRAYIKARGVTGSPELEMTVTGSNGETGTFGDTLQSELATLEITVRNGLGQRLHLIVNGQTLLVLPIDSDDYHQQLPVTRDPDTEGPLGTFVRVETYDEKSITTLGNPVFLLAP